VTANDRGDARRHRPDSSEPHQSSHFVGEVGNAFDRWRGVFDGLHVFMGCGAVTFDNSSEGSRIVELSRCPTSRGRPSSAT
jgi:hypothetical protein